MAVNPAVEGRTYTMPGVHVVTQADVDAFAAAVRSPSAVATVAPVPAHTPLTYAVSVAQRAEAEFMQDPEAGVDFSRLVHGEEGFTYHAPIVAGDELTAVTTVQRVRSAGGHDMVTLSTDVTTTAGEPRVTTTSVVVIRGEGA